MKVCTPAWKLYAEKGDKDAARRAVREVYAFLREHREGNAIRSAFIHSKIGWMWEAFFGVDGKTDWSRPF